MLAKPAKAKAPPKQAGGGCLPIRSFFQKAAPKALPPPPAAPRAPLLESGQVPPPVVEWPGIDASDVGGPVPGFSAAAASAQPLATESAGKRRPEERPASAPDGQQPMPGSVSAQRASSPRRDGERGASPSRTAVPRPAQAGSGM